MKAVQTTGVRRSDAVGLLDLVGHLPTPSGDAWLDALRSRASASLKASGLPNKKVEGWRFTSVAALAQVAFERAPSADASDAVAWAAETLGIDKAHALFVIDGRPVTRPTSALPEGVTVAALAELDAREDATRVGELARTEYFSALNAALFEDALLLEIEARRTIEQPIHVVHVSTTSHTPTASYPRTLVRVGAGAEARLFESYLVREGEKQLTTAVTEVFVADGAHLSRTRIHIGAPNGHHVATLAVRQERDSVYASRVVALGGALYRLEVEARLEGRGADCTLEGVYHVRDQEHVDHQTRIVHAVADGTSRESYRGILDGRGRAVFDGIIEVKKDAQRTNASQENRNLLLSDDATVNTKPHLEIEADDVKCSHGATIGALDDAQLFYLRARGIDEARARDMLTFAFVEAILERIPDAPLAKRLGKILLDRLPHGEAVREMVEMEP